ncbi:MAG: gliding motility-associated-like protein [Salibacteraceae bacterium]|jgi:gliding motility-associated-like protein
MKIIYSILLLSIITTAQAQAPSWSVNSSAYQYDMTITAVIEVNCVELGNTANQIAVSSNGVVRGVAYTSSIGAGRYIAIISAYSNQVSGETLSIQLYDGVGDSIYVSIDSVLFQDNGIVGSPSNPLIFRTNNSPTAIQINSDSIVENFPIGSSVGNFSTSDLDVSQTHSYTLASGVGDTDNGLFSIANNQLNIAFVADYESKANYTVRIRTTDSEGCFIESVFPISILNANDAPTSFAINTDSIDENSPINSYLGNLTTVDQDTNDVFTYSLVSGSGDADNSQFNFLNNQLRTSQVLNFEFQATYSIRVRSTDQSNLFLEDNLILHLRDINDLPTDILFPKDSIDENSIIGTVVGLLSTVDEDASQSFNYSFVSVTNNDNDSFLIVGNQIRTNATLDFENKTIYSVRINTDDSNGGNFSKIFNVKVLDINDSPTNISLSNASAKENLPVGLFISTLSSSDEDLNQSFTYSLVNGVGSIDNSNFNVQNDSLFTAVILDSTAQSQHSIRIETDDQNGGTFSKAFTIFVKDINNAPNDISLSNDTIPENSFITAAVGTLTSADADQGDIHSYALVPGIGDTDNLGFRITGNQLQTNTGFDVNLKTVYSIRIETNDGFGGTFQDTFKIIIINSNDTATDILFSNSIVSENSSSNTLIGNLSAVDVDAVDQHTFELDTTGINDNDLFQINGNELRTDTVFNFEAKSSYSIAITTKDLLGASFSKTHIIIVSDSNDAPTNLSISSDSLQEQSTIGTFVAACNTADEDAIDNFTYSLINGVGDTDNGLFVIRNDSLFSDSALLLNDGVFRSIRILSSDKGSQTVEANFIIRIINRNDTPSDLLLSNDTIQENKISGTLIGNLSSIDADSADQFTYELISGTGDEDNTSFLIVGNELLTNEVFDFEQKNSYTIRIQTADGSNAAYQRTFFIGITNQNEKPNSEDQDFTIAENKDAGTEIGLVVFSDVDNGEVFNYKIIEGNSNFLIDENSGILSAAFPFDYETQIYYTASVEVTDLGGLLDTALLTIEVTDVVEGSLPAMTFISPNSDGINDLWQIRNIELYSNYRLTIFSVNGLIVYDKPNNYNNDWNGTISGNLLDDGLYYYYLVNNEDNSINFKGTITLKK